MVPDKFNAPLWFCRLEEHQPVFSKNPACCGKKGTEMFVVGRLSCCRKTRLLWCGGGEPPTNLGGPRMMEASWVSIWHLTSVFKTHRWLSGVLWINSTLLHRLMSLLDLAYDYFSSIMPSPFLTRMLLSFWTFLVPQPWCSFSSSSTPLHVRLSLPGRFLSGIISPYPNKRALVLQMSAKLTLYSQIHCWPSLFPNWGNA